MEGRIEKDDVRGGIVRFRVALCNTLCSTPCRTRTLRAFREIRGRGLRKGETVPRLVILRAIHLAIHRALPDATCSDGASRPPAPGSDLPMTSPPARPSFYAGAPCASGDAGGRAAATDRRAPAPQLGAAPARSHLPVHVRGRPRLHSDAGGPGRGRAYLLLDRVPHRGRRRIDAVAGRHPAGCDEPEEGRGGPAKNERDAGKEGARADAPGASPLRRTGDGRTARARPDRTPTGRSRNPARPRAKGDVRAPDSGPCDSGPCDPIGRRGSGPAAGRWQSGHRTRAMAPFRFLDPEPAFILRPGRPSSEHAETTI